MRQRINIFKDKEAIAAAQAAAAQQQGQQGPAAGALPRGLAEDDDMSDSDGEELPQVRGEGGRKGRGGGLPQVRGEGDRRRTASGERGGRQEGEGCV